MFPSYYRVELTFRCKLSQIPAVLIKRRGLALFIFAVKRNLIFIVIAVFAHCDHSINVGFLDFDAYCSQ